MGTETDQLWNAKYDKEKQWLNRSLLFIAFGEEDSSDFEGGI